MILYSIKSVMWSIESKSFTFVILLLSGPFVSTEANEENVYVIEVVTRSM
jgi:hypothetical protein